MASNRRSIELLSGYIRKHICECALKIFFRAIAGIVGRLTVTPLAVLRIRLQVYIYIYIFLGKLSNVTKKLLLGFQVQLQPKYTTLWPSLKLILAEEGIRV